MVAQSGTAAVSNRIQENRFPQGFPGSNLLPFFFAKKKVWSNPKKKACDFQSHNGCSKKKVRATALEIVKFLKDILKIVTMKSIYFNFPRMYNAVVSIINGKYNKERYELISKEIGKNKIVFEPGCSTGLIKNQLDNSCEYIGWDLNSKFIAYAKKKGLNVEVRDAFDFSHYPKCDVILIMDILHHVGQNHEKLIDEAKKRSRKVIVAEPFESFILAPSFKAVYKYKGLKRKFTSFPNFFFGDNDGINPPDTVFDWNHDEQSLREFFKRKGAKKIYKSGPNLIGIF